MAVPAEKGISPAHRHIPQIRIPDFSIANFLSGKQPALSDFFFVPPQKKILCLPYPNYHTAADTAAFCLVTRADSRNRLLTARGISWEISES